MAEPAVPITRPPLELSLPEARSRFGQLARLASLAQQTTVVTDGGRKVAAIVPINHLRDDDDRPSAAAAGWLRRIERVRADLRRQHTALEEALEQAWRELDRLGPPGADRDIDALRAAHSGIRGRL